MALAPESATDVLVVVLEAHRDAWAALQTARRVRNDALSDQQYVHAVSPLLPFYTTCSALASVPDTFKLRASAHQP